MVQGDVTIIMIMIMVHFFVHAKIMKISSDNFMAQLGDISHLIWHGYSQQLSADGTMRFSI